MLFMYVSIASIWDYRCCDRVAMSQVTSSSQGRADCQITKYCCFLQNPEGTAHGCGFIVKFEGIKLLALDWEKRRKIEVQTDYALITSHDTIPDSSDLNGWKVSCEGIGNGNLQTLSNLVCGVISCCGPKTLFAGHSSDANVFRSHRGDAGCDIQLNIAILFLTKLLKKLLQDSPPVIPVNVYLDQESYTQKYKQISNTGGELVVYYCDKTRSVKSTVVLLADRQGTSTGVVAEQQNASVHKQGLSQEIIEFEKLQKLEANSRMKICHGSPVVHLDPDPNKSSVIGVYVGKTNRHKEQDIVVTFHGILRLLQGGLIPVLSVLKCLDIPHAWVSRWGYLITPHIDRMKKMESGYLCEVLHFLLKERHGTSLVKLPVDLVEVDNEASLNLLCALFKHFKSADNAELNKAVTKLNLENEMNAYITQLCKDVIHLLELGAHMVTDRTSLVEKCLTFYNLLLDFKYAEITERVLSTSQNLELLKHILKRYKHSGAVQKNVIDIILKGFPLSSKELLTLIEQILPQDVIDSLQHKGLDLNTTENFQTTLEEVQQLLHSSKEHVSLQQLLDLALENWSHYEAYQQALKEEVAIPLKYLKVLFFGPPRTGKTSMRRRLVGEILNLANEPVQASTGTAEHYDVIVKLFEDKTTTSTAIILKSEHTSVSEWSSIGKDKSTHETDIKEELLLLYRFIYGVFPTENKPPVSTVNRLESKDSRSPVPVIEKDAQNEFEVTQSPARVETDTVPSPVLVGVDPNASTPQASSVREHVLSSKQNLMEEIKEAFEAFDEILRAGEQKQLKVLLDGTILMNMVDTGGHPAFLEMLPALTMGPALYLIFFRLNQELKNTYQIQYVSKDREKISLGDSSYTVEEVLFQALSSISCFSCTEPRENMPIPSHAAMLIGTHKDLLEGDPETVAKEIKIKDTALSENLKTDFLESETDFIHNAFEDQLMFAIDNMTGDKEELKKVRKRLEDVINQEFNDFSIPASWLMFSIFLRKMGKRTMSLSQCREIGKRLEVRDTDEALWFLHHCVGILMHFPDVEEIKDIVICDPQVVFDSVTDLILNSLNFKRVTASNKFEQTGQFRFNKTSKNTTSDHLPLKKLVKLLEYLNIIACCNSSPQSDVHHESYFMPAVLKHATVKELHMEQRPTDPVPLVIHFKCGFVPIGVFCAIIASLYAQWKVLGPRYGHILRKNRVTFRINGTYNITLISKNKWFEIYIARISPEGQSLEKMCRHVLKTVCDTLDQVLPKMKYKLPSFPSDSTLYELGFKCPEHPNNDHLVINKPFAGTEAPSAKLLWFDYREDPKSTMICSLEEKAISFELSKSLPDRSLVWFGEATKISSVLPDSQLDKETSHAIQLDERNVMNVLREAKFSAGHWEQLGLQLTDCASLTTIKAKRHGDPSLCMRDTISQWLRTDTKRSWEKLADAVTWTGEYGEATAASVLQKAGVVRTFDFLTQEADITFSVETTEDHDLQFQWQKDGKDIDSDESQFLPSRTGHSSTLRIQSVGKSDKGHYKCLVKSPVEKSRRKSLHAAELQVFDPPKIAQDPEARVTSGKRNQLEEKEHEYLSGFEVFAETSFVVPDSRSHSFEWQGHGLKLHIPEGAVPAHTGCRVDFKAGFTGQFNIPDDLQLVSCVYWLSCSQKFAKPVTLEIEHCASLQDSSQSSSVSFIAAECSQAKLPYKFEVLEGGKFAPKSSYGSIQVSQFSFFAIIISKIFPSPQRYCCTHHYIQKGHNKWDVDFVITPHLQASLTVIKEKYSSLDATTGADFEVQFEDEAISLAIPEDGVCLPNGWAIRPLVSPIITKQQVDMFKPGQLIPCCQLRVKLDNCENPVELQHKVNVLGTKDPRKFFTITCSPQASHTRSCISLPPLWILILLLAVVIGAGLWWFGTNCHYIASKQDLFLELAEIGNWQSLCSYLKVPEAVINNLENEHLKNNARKQRCLSAYFDQGKACWEKVIQVVAGDPFHKKKLASQIAEKYDVNWQE